jgi:hypothetical protein
VGTLQATGGDGDADDVEGMKLWSSADDGTWKPDCWRKSPQQIQEEARLKNIVAFSLAAASAGKHSNPPNNPWERDT